MRQPRHMRGFFCSFKMMKPAAFGKQEHLKRRKQIDALFAEGKSVTAFPVRVKYQWVPRAEGAVPVLAGVSASRRAFKHAADRNRLKRLLREAYRLQKASLVQTLSGTALQAQLFFIYTNKTTIAPFSVVYEAVGACLKQLQQKASAYHEDRH